MSENKYDVILSKAVKVLEYIDEIAECRIEYDMILYVALEMSRVERIMRVVRNNKSGGGEE